MVQNMHHRNDIFYLLRMHASLFRVRISWKCFVSFLSASAATFAAELHYVARIMHRRRRVIPKSRTRAHSNANQRDVAS